MQIRQLEVLRDAADFATFVKVGVSKMVVGFDAHLPSERHHGEFFGAVHEVQAANLALVLASVRLNSARFGTACPAEPDAVLLSCLLQLGHAEPLGNDLSGLVPLDGHQIRPTTAKAQYPKAAIDTASPAANMHSPFMEGLLSLGVLGGAGTEINRQPEHTTFWRYVNRS